MDTIVSGLIARAAKSDIGQKHAAVALCHNRVISPMFTNTLRSYISRIRVDCLHAEVAVLHYLVKASLHSSDSLRFVDYSDPKFRKLQKKLARIDIVVIRRSPSGNLMLSKPCSACTCILKKLGIRRVYFSDENQLIVSEKVRDLVSSHLSQMQRVNARGETPG
jgi:tRNA(Arg) A34 adenosine deaminase TadA